MLREVTVKTQEELDAIPDDFKGRIYIEGGTPFARIYVRKNYFFRVVARGNSSVEARGNSSVEAWENSSVVAWENSSVVARGNSSVEAWENSSVVAWENSSVVAWGNSSVEAWENSSVVARGNSQIVDLLQGAKIKISGNARVVFMPKTIFDFMDFYGIRHTKTFATFYKAVHKSGKGLYRSDYTKSFVYQIGDTLRVDCNSDVTNECGSGLHLAHLDWALNYGSEWNDLAILEVKTKIADIVLPIASTGKVRTSKLKVIREVPLEECGVYGKILSKRKLDNGKDS